MCCICAVGNGGNLLLYSENAIDVFDYEKMLWQQTIPLKKVRPLSTDGSLNIVTSLEPHKLVYMARKIPGERRGHGFVLF